MVRRLPPLNALRAFEAAARHLSFKRAAEELAVTPAAISQQIRQLEETLGLKLFRRLPRALLLTDAGQRALPEVTAAFDRLARAVEAMRAADTTGALTVSVAPSIGGKWLVPRLGRFREAHPDIDVRIDASESLVDFDRDDVDVAVRFGGGQYPGLRTDLLLSEAAFPVCAPALAGGLCEPEDLARATLLHVGREALNESLPTWAMWLKAAGVEGADARAGPRFSDYAMLIQAAVAGQGVALGPRALVADELADGRLVRPFGAGGESEVAFRYFLVCPEATAERPKVSAFREWLLGEAGVFEREGDGG